MTVVLDASAAYDLLTEGRCGGRIAGADELIAPDLIVPELLNACWKVARSGAVAPGSDLAIEFLSRVRLLPTLPYARDAVALAERLGHPVYDCIYIALAQAERARLLTVDERLAKKLRASALSRILR